MPKIELRYFGSSAFEITSEKGVKVLIDPCLTGHGPSSVTPESLDRVDLILVSHGAWDHFGDTLALAKRTGCEVICGPDISTYLTRKGINPKQIHRTIFGMVHEYKGLRIRILESHHVSFLDAEGACLTGVPLGFIVYTESGMGIYHPGDTSIFGDMKLFGELYRPQLGLLPIGLPIVYPGGQELSPEEAAIVAKWMNLKTVIPMHYVYGSSAPQDFSRFMQRESPNTKIIIMERGQKIVYEF